MKKTGSRRRKVFFFFLLLFFTLAIKMTCVVSTRHKQLDDPANVFVEPGFKDETSPFPSACFYLLTFSTCLPVVALPGG